MPIEKIEDHAERSKSRLPKHFNGAAKFLSIFDTIGARFQELENQFFNLLDLRHLTVATGAQLDGIGQILDLERLVGQSDSDYRAALIARSGELAKSGEMESLIGTFYNLTNATYVSALEYFPAGVSLIATNDSDPESLILDESTLQSMNLVKAAGVELILQIAETDAFELSDVSEVDASNNGPISSTNGLGDEILTEGGSLSRVIT